MPKKPASPATINPPEGWKDGEGFGFLYGRDAQGESVDLVRLSDLVRWLQSTRKIGRKEALQAVIDALPEDAMGWLYSLQPNDVAVRVSPNEAFGQMTTEVLEGRIKRAKETHQDALSEHLNHERGLGGSGFGRRW